jgi:hypothetical protein
MKWTGWTFIIEGTNEKPAHREDRSTPAPAL